MTTLTSLNPRASGAVTYGVVLSRGDEKITTEITRHVIDEVQFTTEINNNQPVIVGHTYPVTFAVRRKDGSVIESWDAPLQVSVRGGNASMRDTLLRFQNGIATTMLVAGTRSSQASF